MSDDSAEILFQSFLQETTERFWYGRECPLIEVAHPAFPLLITALPTLQGALKDGFGETVMAFDVPEPCKFSSLDSCQKRFLRTHKEVHFALYPVVRLVFQVGDMEKFPHALGFKSLDPFFSVSNQGPCFTTKEEIVTKSKVRTES